MVVRACQQVQDGARIKRLTIVIGEASGHDPRHIQEHFAEASRGTSAEGAVLEFIDEKLAARCASCGETYSSADLALKCAHCGGTELVITAGNDVRLADVEI
jgi:hydrogenase nickel incorporation protein HypA/HybF